MLSLVRSAAAGSSAVRLIAVPRLLRSAPRWVAPLRVASLRRAQSTGASKTEGAGAAAGAEGGAGAGGAEGGSAGDAATGEDDGSAAAAEPLVARVSRMIWGTIKLVTGIAIVGGVLYAGYSIVTVLIPVGTSSNSIMRRASDVLSADPDVEAYFGSIKTYGIDLGGRQEGRRFFVPEYKYEDDLTGESYHRVKFTLEGERGRKATVYAEVSSSTGEYRYLLVVSPNFASGGKVISLIDRRSPKLTKDERQARVTSLLQDGGWSFVADNDVDASEQARVLGDYHLKVKIVNDAERAAAAGVVGSAWLSNTGAVEGKGVRDLAQLEHLTQRLAREKLRGSGGGWFSWAGFGGSGSGSGAGKPEAA